MVTSLTLVLVAVAGALAGGVIQAWISRQRYRRDEERSLPRSFVGWIAPVSAIASALIWWTLAGGVPLLVATVYVLATWVMVVLAAIDLDVHRLPDAIQLPAYPVTVVLLAACSLTTGDWAAMKRSLLAGVAMFALFFILVLIAPAGGMGFGDVKLAGLLGLLLGWLSWGHVLVAGIVTFLLGGVVAVALLATRRAARGGEFAYGPVMLVSACATIIFLARAVAAAL